MVSQTTISQLNHDGSLNRGYALPAMFGSMSELYQVTALSASDDGRVLMAGGFSDYETPHLVRLRADGSQDLSFDEGTGFQARAGTGGDAYLKSVAELPSGGWLVGGDFGSYDGFNQNYLVRVLPETISRPYNIQFAISNVTVWETNGVLALEVQRGGDASGPASVAIKTQDGTATANQDYTPLDTRLNFQPGEWTKKVTLLVFEDHKAENDEQFTVQLSNPSSGYYLFSPTNVTVTIKSSDAEVDFIANSFHGVEEDGFVMVGAKWSGALSSNLHASVSITPVSDNAGDLGVSSFPVDYASAVRGTNWFRIPIVDDAVHESTREYRLTLTGTGYAFPGSVNEAALLIDDGDFPTTPARGVAGVVAAIANSPDGGVYLGGDFTGVHGTPLHNAARLLPDGEVDQDFNPGPGPNGPVWAVAVQPGDGKVLIAGGFSKVDDVPRAGLARLNTDGSLDSAFDVGLGAQNTNGTPFVRFLLPQNGGSLFVGGKFTEFNGHPTCAIAKLHSDGDVDTLFASPFGAPVPLTFPWQTKPPYGPWLLSPTGIVTSDVNALAELPDGKLLAVVSDGTFGHVVAVGFRRVVRISPDGSLDTNFINNIMLPTGSLRNALALTSDGKILLGSRGGSLFSGVRLPPYYDADTNWIAIRRLETNGQVDTTFQVTKSPVFFSGHLRLAKSWFNRMGALSFPLPYLRRV